MFYIITVVNLTIIVIIINIYFTYVDLLFCEYDYYYFVVL